METSKGTKKNAGRKERERVCCVFLTAGKRPKEPGDVMGYGYRLQKFFATALIAFHKGTALQRAIFHLCFPHHIRQRVRS